MLDKVYKKCSPYSLNGRKIDITGYKGLVPGYELEFPNKAEERTLINKILTESNLVFDPVTVDTTKGYISSGMFDFNKVYNNKKLNISILFEPGISAYLTASIVDKNNESIASIIISKKERVLMRKLGILNPNSVN